MVEPTAVQAMTREEYDRIEQFLAHYNAVKEKLAHLTDKPEKSSLNELVSAFGSERKRWLAHDGAALLKLGEMRNLLVHERNEPYEYLFAPTELALRRIAHINERLTAPLRIAETLGKQHVECVTPRDSMVQVLRLVVRNDYSQFPVYDGAAFLGILTTNGIARWLSDNFAEDNVLSCVTDCQVADVLRREEPVAMAFIDGRETVEDVIDRFTDNLELVCLLITDTGNQMGKPQQIVTRYDVAGLLARLLAEED